MNIRYQVIWLKRRQHIRIIDIIHCIHIKMNIYLDQQNFSKRKKLNPKFQHTHRPFHKFVNYVVQLQKIQTSHQYSKIIYDNYLGEINFLSMIEHFIGMFNGHFIWWKKKVIMYSYNFIPLTFISFIFILFFKWNYYWFIIFSHEYIIQHAWFQHIFKSNKNYLKGTSIY